MDTEFVQDCTMVVTCSSRSEESESTAEGMETESFVGQFPLWAHFTGSRAQRAGSHQGREGAQEGQQVKEAGRIRCGAHVLPGGCAGWRGTSRVAAMEQSMEVPSDPTVLGSLCDKGEKLCFTDRWLCLWSFMQRRCDQEELALCAAPSTFPQMLILQYVQATTQPNTRFDVPEGCQPGDGVA